MVDHGDIDIFYLDEINQQRLTPGQLHIWLSEVEQQIKNVKVNVIIEACHAGSFINGEQSISKPGRVIITSSNENADAYASKDGTSFSDQFITALNLGYNLYRAWWLAKIAVEQQHERQVPWIDADGDQQANQLGDADSSSARNIIASDEERLGNSLSTRIQASTGRQRISERRSTNH